MQCSLNKLSKSIRDTLLRKFSSNEWTTLSNTEKNKWIAKGKEATDALLDKNDKILSKLVNLEKKHFKKLTHGLLSKYQLDPIDLLDPRLATNSVGYLIMRSLHTCERAEQLLKTRSN